MALYAYKGVGPAGRNVNGVREADSPKALRQLMRKDGVVVTECIISKGGKATSAKGGLSREVRLGEALSRISSTDVTAFTRQMATLLRSGIPLAETLAALADQIEKVRFKVVVNQVKNAVNEGASLGDALAKHPRAFNELFVSMVRAGELAGNLDDVLGRLADFMESSQKLKSRVTGALIYPAIMVLVCAGIMTILMVYVVPEITKMFVQQGKELPWNTSLLIFVSDFMGRYLLFLVVGTGLAIAGFLAWTRSPNGRPVWHRAILHMPLIGPLLRMVAVARFARTLGTMLQSGVPMLRALEISREVVGNVIIKKAIDDARVAVQEGESLAITLKKSGHFPASMIHMVAVGERAGELEQMLMRIADAYDAEVEGKVTRLTTALEPLMLVGMGAAVGFIVVSILTPMMDLAKLGKPGGR